MQSYEFPYPEAEQQTVVSRFGGIDFRTHPTKGFPVPLARPAEPDLRPERFSGKAHRMAHTGAV